MDKVVLTHITKGNGGLGFNFTVSVFGDKNSLVRLFRFSLPFLRRLAQITTLSFWTSSNFGCLCRTVRLDCNGARQPSAREQTTARTTPRTSLIYCTYYQTRCGLRVFVLLLRKQKLYFELFEQISTYRYDNWRRDFGFLFLFILLWFLFRFLLFGRWRRFFLLLISFLFTIGRKRKKQIELEW